jgi:hypothetical protein
MRFPDVQQIQLFHMRAHAKTAALARIAAVTPQLGVEGLVADGFGGGAFGKAGARSMSGEPDVAPEKITDWL